MKTPSTVLIFATLLALSLMNFGCVKRDIDKISEAQECLDRSTSTTALACMSKVEGVETAGGHLIRCSAYFIDQGFADPTRLASVAQQVSNSNGSPADSTFAALSVMGFTASKYTSDENFTNSEAAFAYCSKSKSPGLIYLSSLTRISTALLHDLGFDPSSGTPPSTTDIQNQMCSPGGPTQATKIAIGSAAIAAYNSDCVMHPENSTDAVCVQYATALAVSSDPETVGGLLADNLCP